MLNSNAWPDLQLISKKWVDVTYTLDTAHDQLTFGVMPLTGSTCSIQLSSVQFICCERGFSDLLFFVCTIFRSLYSVSAQLFLFVFTLKFNDQYAILRRQCVRVSYECKMYNVGLKCSPFKTYFGKYRKRSRRRNGDSLITVDGRLDGLGLSWIVRAAAI